MLSRKLLTSTLNPHNFKAFSTVINYEKKYVSIDCQSNEPGIFHSVGKVFYDRNLNLSYFDGRHLFTNKDGKDTVRFNLSFDSNNDEELELLKKDFKDIGMKMRSIGPETVEWFPYQESHLDLMGNVLQSPDDGLNQDHPGFTDKEYLQRRNLIAENAKGYKMKTPIPNFDYNENETGLWTKIWDALHPKLLEHGCKEYITCFNKLVEAGLFKRDTIPQLEDLNQFLQRESNWRIKPVNGILSQREFLNCLAFRTFCCTQYIRHHSNPEYTPEPDILHEFMGHVPMFADKQVCDISQLIGALSLGASDAQVALLGAIYWFTIEFGTCLEDGENKFYGAGVASSYGEIDNMVSCEDIRELDLINNPPPVKFIVQDVQPFYYQAKSFQDVIIQLEDLSDSLYRPFHTTYDFRTNSYSLDRAVIMKDQPQEIEGLAF